SSDCDHQSQQSSGERRSAHAILARCAVRTLTHSQGGTTMSVLITGGVGAIGSNVARTLLTRGKKVVVYDRAPPAPDNKVLAGLGDNLQVEVGNITDLASLLDVIKRHNVEGIIHCAGM